MSALARFTSLDLRPGPGLLRGLVRRGGRMARHLSAACRFTASGPGRRPVETDEPFVRVGSLARGRGRRLALRAGLMGLAAAGLAAGGLAAASRLVAPASPQALSVAPAPRWSEIHHPLALYDLPGTEFSKLDAGYRARRREPDGAREDLMTFGRLGEPRPFLTLTLLRSGAGPSEGAGDGLADGLARLASIRGLGATRIRPAAPVGTRLGRFEAADLLLWNAAGASAPCLGFRGGGPVLRVSGFACGAPGKPLGRAALACAIDRLDLVSAGEDAALRAVFVAAERSDGSTCLGGPSLAAAGSGHLGWLDPDGEMPPLRGLFEATIRQR